jgi:hypothetical protein
MPESNQISELLRRLGKTDVFVTPIAMGCCQTTESAGAATRGVSDFHRRRKMAARSAATDTVPTTPLVGGPDLETVE